MIPQYLLHDLFDYDPVTGFFTNCYSRGRAKIGARAGSPTGNGYRRIVIGYDKCYEHHVAWMYVYGEWPDEIDHKDGDRGNNAIDNLRQATRTQNNFNADRTTGTSALRGAYFDHRVQRWYSKIQIGGVVKWLGYFDSAEDAHRAHMVEIETHHGEFAFHNRNTEVGAA